MRFACDAYVALVRDSPLVVAVASSLTEMFAPDLMSARIAAWEQHYPWVGAEALGYFKVRVTRARKDGEEGLAFVVANANTRALQDACVAARMKEKFKASGFNVKQLLIELTQSDAFLYLPERQAQEAP